MQSLNTLYTPAIVACLWDFDKTLIPGYMQEPLFDEYGIDAKVFWEEVNELPNRYAKQGIKVSKDTVYLNHLLSYVKHGKLKGLSNKKLKELGQYIKFYPGLPDFFNELKLLSKSQQSYVTHGITLEHYVISTGLAEMIKGSKIAPFVEGIYGCEFIEEPLPPGYINQKELPLNFENNDNEISQIGFIVDNTIKTRFIYEINKGVNKNSEIDVNASMKDEDRRVPIKNMIYTADGPSDIPAFAVMRHEGGRAYAVYHPDEEKEFAQNDALLQSGRIHQYGPADYRPNSTTFRWMRMNVLKIFDNIVEEREKALSDRVAKPPVHLHKTESLIPSLTLTQPHFFE